MGDIRDDYEIENALKGIAKLIEEMWTWGLNAKDPLGNFMPAHFADEAKTKLSRLERTIISARKNEGRGNIPFTYWTFKTFRR